MPERGREQRFKARGAPWSRRAVLTNGGVAGAGALTGGVTACTSQKSGGADDDLKEKIEHPPENLNQKGFPIVKKPVTIRFMTRKPPATAKDYNTVASWKKYQKMTNIRIEWGLVPEESIEEKRNLALSSGDYPEAFYGPGTSIRDIGKCGNQGVFIRLNELIDQHMPNLKRLMSDNNDIKQGMTFPDGSIYGLPYIFDPDFTALRLTYRPWVRGDWLDKFDMDTPSTIDEYYRYLKAVKSKRPNGKERAIPFGSSRKVVGLYNALRGSFGVGNRGGGKYIDADPDDQSKVRFFPLTEGYQELMQYLNKLYSGGLIAKNIFSIDESEAFDAESKGVYGSTIDVAPYNLHGGKARQFVPMPALKGPDGQHDYNNLAPPLVGFNFVITDKADHPVELARWADYFYSNEGATLYFMGVKGKSYKKTGDGVEYLPDIKHLSKGKTQEEALKPYTTYMGGSHPGIIIKKDYYKGAESSAESVKAATLLEPDVQKKVWPEFTFTEKEFQRLESMANDIEKYVDESRDKFISGHMKVSEWEKYAEKLKVMGLDDYLEIHQAAYDRYRKG